MQTKLAYSKTGIVLSFFIIYQLIFAPTTLLVRINNQWLILLLSIIMLSLAIGFIRYTYRMIQQIAPWQGYFIQANTNQLMLGISLLLLLLLQLGTTYLTTHQLVVNSQNQSENLKQLNHNPFLMGVIISLIAPILEELIFRGLFYKLLLANISLNQLKKTTYFLMFFINGLLFTIPHLTTLSWDWCAYLLMALIFSVNFLYYRSIKVPIILHIFNNLVAILLC